MLSKETTNEVFGQISNRMKYGAPELKKFYRKYVTRGLSISVTASVCLSLLSFGYVSRVNQKTNKEIVTPDRIFYN